MENFYDVKCGKMQNVEMLNKDNFYIVVIVNESRPQKINFKCRKTFNAKTLNPDQTVFINYAPRYEMT
jgi:hypothetical protein